VPLKLGDRRRAIRPRSSKTRDVLGCQPPSHDLDEIVRTAWAWHQVRG
jgi:UDP-glucose 4-epimerase